VLIADRQTGGRGRLGRSFSSPAGSGIYMSVILRPGCTAAELMHLTCAVAVAMCNAIEKVTGFRPAVKWINDLVLNRRKLGGILTELSMDPQCENVEYVIAGIGINCLHQKEDFPEELQEKATSLAMHGISVEPAALVAAMIRALYRMDSTTYPDRCRTMDQYRKDCITMNREVLVLRGDSVRPGIALDVDDEGALAVAFPDGTSQLVNSGEVSVRGVKGYI
jgi:BirA family biotin operon repressor/biotin-[acetyl-CoA-carboxylase] ligase